MTILLGSKILQEYDYISESLKYETASIFIKNSCKIFDRKSIWKSRWPLHCKIIFQVCTFFLSDANSVVLVPQMLGSTPIESSKTTIDTSMILQAPIWLTKMNWWNKRYRLDGQVCLEFDFFFQFWCLQHSFIRKMVNTTKFQACIKFGDVYHF